MGGRECDELDVLFTNSHVAVLGDPGAGKTTTLRNLARHVALEPEVDENDPFKFVVLVVCRDEDWRTDDLYDVIGAKVGVTGKLAADLDNPESRIREVLNAGALVLIDGLDEVPSAQRVRLEQSVMSLGRHLVGGKVIVSCRSADYVTLLSGFEPAEILPLSDKQIARVAEDLLGADAAEAFDEAMHQRPGNPVAELTNRPLFLAQMLAIYRRRGTIPERPVDLYAELTRLIIQEWDEQRGVHRSSKYDDFGVDAKRNLLADLALDLVHRQLIRFDESQLEESFVRLADRYGLPKADARRVARELEAHTGLLVQSGAAFEFSHLSLQEYLAADAMSRAGIDGRREWWSSPAVAAVAVALSSDPNGWLGDLVSLLPNFLDDCRPLQPFLYRLGQERPRFTRSIQLGKDVLELLWRARNANPASVEPLHELRSVRDSVADAISSFDRVTIERTATRMIVSRDPKGEPVDVLSASTALLTALVGQERLRQAASPAPSTM